jgi:hypothetical protein
MKTDEWQYYFEELSGRRHGGPYRTIAGLKSALQTGSWFRDYNREQQRYISIAEHGVIIKRAKVVFDEEWSEEYKK